MLPDAVLFLFLVHQLEAHVPRPVRRKCDQQVVQQVYEEIRQDAERWEAWALLLQAKGACKGRAKRLPSRTSHADKED